LEHIELLSIEELGRCWTSRI